MFPRERGRREIDTGRVGATVLCGVTSQRADKASLALLVSNKKDTQDVEKG